jgi:Domain of unknown function (DUF4157)
MTRRVSSHTVMNQQRASKTSEPEPRIDLSRAAVRQATTGASIHPLIQLQSKVGNRALGSLLQAKLKVSQPGDQYEQEADRVADQVMRVPIHDVSPVAISSRINDSNLQRACSRCEEEEARQQNTEEDDERHLQAKSNQGGVATTSVAEAAVGKLKGGGEPLPESTRAFFEPRFGYDFNHVRIHTDAQAAESAAALQAVAYTIGSHIVFQAGRYEPQTSAGRSLLAHELTHVVQQTNNLGSDRSSGAGVTHEHAQSSLIQRMSLGTGTPPNWSVGTLSVVPPGELRRVNEAIGLIQAVVNNPRGYDDCHNYFARNCPGGSANSMANTFARAVIWKLHEPGGNLARGDAPGSNIAYTQAGYNQGTEALASTLVHEMLHNCGITGASEHYLADVAGLYCMGAGRNQFSLRSGPTIGGGFPFVLLMSYRRFLTEWASGRLQLMLGGDINIPGLAAESDTRYRLGGAEYGSAMLGLQGRSNLLWGGERFGGFTARAETGFGVGRYTLRSPTPTEVPSTAVYPGFVLQIGVGAEFYIPTGGGRVMPVSLDAAYRMSQPLNAEAERIHALLFGFSLPF